jgi:hypothetical protein
LIVKESSPFGAYLDLAGSSVALALVKESSPFGAYLDSADDAAKGTADPSPPGKCDDLAVGLDGLDDVQVGVQPFLDFGCRLIPHSREVLGEQQVLRVGADL